jgi:hypothetical protein
MMTILLLLPLFQAAPGRSVEAAAKAFADGEEAARAETAKAGPGAMLALRKVRSRSPGRVDPLLYELKKAAGKLTPDQAKELESDHGLDPGTLRFADAADGLGGPFSVILDPTLLGDLPEKKVTVVAKRPRRETLESICAQAGVDYAFFCGVVLVSTPERLWPPAPPLPRGPLSDEERARAARWIEDLGSDLPDERAKAFQGLKELATAAIPILEKNVPRGDSEIAGRCSDLLQLARKPPPSALFRDPAAGRQRLEGADAVLAKSLRESAISFKVSDIHAPGAFILFTRPRDLKCTLTPAVENVRMTLDLQNLPTWAALAIMCHAYGLDFLIERGGIHVGTSEEIERMLGP